MNNNNIKRKTYEDLCQENGRSVSADVIGLKKIVVKDFNDVLCPFCGERMKISGIDFCGDMTRETHVTHNRVFVDDYGIRHATFYGREDVCDTHKLYMECPSRCVENMAINVTNIRIGLEKELVEMGMHGK